jgi:hypothetical protein
MPDVLGALVDWPKSHVKMPTPADVLKAARERLSERTERAANEVGKQDRQPFAAERLRGDPSDPAYQAFKRDVAALADRGRPAGKEWAHRLRARERDGEPLGAVQSRLWREALRVPQGEAA